MCGIAGIYAWHKDATPIDQEELIRMRDHMASRGPDGKGVWIGQSGHIGLAHRRLSIIDLSQSGSQPMVSADGRYVITYNGEIYNFKELRRHLENRGCSFRSQSDTEVLLQLYDAKGPEMVHDLRGMFAFAIWDNQLEKLFLARDPYGIKPLYYSGQGRTFRFSSQAKSLLAGGNISREPDPAGLTGFYLFGSVPEPFTIWRDIHALPAGTTLIIDGHGPQSPTSYFSLASIYDATAKLEDKEQNREELQEVVRDLLLDSVRYHLVSDVPVGAFLSAGIDSGALVGLMRDAGQSDIRTITLSFEEFSGRHNDETDLAEQTARLYETNHTSRFVTKAEFYEDLPRIIDAMDQPSIDGINTWFVSKAAHEAGLKVAISGLGGDELFGGYSTFSDLPKWVGWMSLPSNLPFLGTGLRRVAMAVGVERFGIPTKAAGLLEYGGTYAGAYLLRRGLFMPWELEKLLGSDFVCEGMARLKPLELLTSSIKPMPQSTFARVACLESSFYMRNQLLRDTDWASMAHSLEVRVPLVDAALLKRIAPISQQQNSNIKDLLGRSPTVPLPDNIIYRRKTGFSIPVEQWMQSTTESQNNMPSNAGSWSRRWSSMLGKHFTENEPILGMIT